MPSLLPRLLRENRDFRRVWSGLAVSQLGDQVTLVALPLTAVLALDASPAQMGYLTAAAVAPNLLFALHAGEFVDRVGRRRATMVAADLARLALMASLPIAFWLGHLTFVQLYIVAFLAGTASLLFMVAHEPLFSLMLERDEFLAGTSLLSGSRAVAGVLGPGLGGVLVQLLRGPGALAVDAVSFLWSAVMVRGVQVTESSGEREDGGGVLVGLRWLWSERVLRAKLLSASTINFFNFAFAALFMLYATSTLGVRPAELGVVLGFAGVGAVSGALVTGRLSVRIGVGPTYVVGCLLFVAPLLLVPLSGSATNHGAVVAMLFVAEALSGFGVMLLDISAGAISAALVPVQMRGRVTGAFLLVNYGIRPVGALAGGALAQRLGMQPALWIATTGALAGVLVALPSPLPRLRELPAPAHGQVERRSESA